MTQTTRQEFLDTAERLFAARGFYGTSLAAISDDLGLTKQALLHHFGSKEKLYGEVLARISTRFDALLAEKRRWRTGPKGTSHFFAHNAAHGANLPDRRKRAS